MVEYLTIGCSTAQTALFNVTLNYTESGNLTSAASPASMSPEEELVMMAISQPYNILALMIGSLGIGANILSLVAVAYIKGPLASRYRAFISLALSDILIALSVMGHILFRELFPEEDRLMFQCSYMTIKALNSTALNMTLLNLVGMAVDHYLAIMKPFQYQRLLSRPRSIIMIVLLWLIAIIAGFIGFASPLWDSVTYNMFKDTQNYCEIAFLTTFHEEYIVFGIALFSLMAMVFIYTRVYLEVRRVQNEGPPGQEMYKNKKALVTTLLILGTFIVCWLPLCLLNIIMIIEVKVDPGFVHDNKNVVFMVERYLFVLLVLNTLLDPIIYVIRIRDVQKSYTTLFYKFLSYWCKCLHIRSKFKMGLRESTLLTTSIAINRRPSPASFSSFLITEKSVEQPPISPTIHEDDDDDNDVVPESVNETTNLREVIL